MTALETENSINFYRRNREIHKKKQNYTLPSLPPKATGPDGFTGEFDQTFKYQIVPILLNLF